MTDTARIDAAYHEAGHAVALHLLAPKLTIIGINCMVPGLMGQVRYGGNFTIPDGYGLVSFGLLVHCLCGAEAGRRATGRSREESGRADNIACRVILNGKHDMGGYKVLSAKAQQILFFAAVAEAELFVETHWKLIQAVAAALLEKDYLLGEEVVRIINTEQ